MYLHRSKRSQFVLANCPDSGLSEPGNAGPRMYIIIRLTGQAFTMLVRDVGEFLADSYTSGYWMSFGRRPRFSLVLAPSPQIDFKT